MKLQIIYDDSAQEPKITVICRELSAELQRAIASLQAADRRLTGVKDGQTFLLPPEEVVYIDTADKHMFIYTSGEVYETQLRLYELEKQLPPSDFFRANKSCIVGIRHIRSLKADIDGRRLLTMDSGDKLWVSRQYAAEFRKKIGM